MPLPLWANGIVSDPKITWALELALETLEIALDMTDDWSLKDYLETRLDKIEAGGQ